MRSALRPSAVRCAGVLFIAGWSGCGQGPPPSQKVTHPKGPIDSDLAAYFNGGGCYPTGVKPSQFDRVVLVNPEWAPVAGGPNIDSDPIVAHGTAVWTHGDTGGDFPATHVRSDVNAALKLDADDEWLLATGNGDGKGDKGTLELEWEASAFPAWAWAGAGDRIVAMGRWIFDCGHPDSMPGHCSASAREACVVDADCQSPLCASCAASETCLGAHFRYSSEVHPPEASASIRSGRGGLVSPDAGAVPVPATRVDVLVSPNGGAAGDRCVQTHQDPLSDLIFSTNCYPLAQPIAPLNAHDFQFDVPLPARPSDGQVAWRVEMRDAPGGVPADLEVVPHDADAQPHLSLTVKMTRPKPSGTPTGYAATIFAGWKTATSSLTHVRVTVSGLAVTNALKPKVPVVREAKSWNVQAAVNGEWQLLAGLDDVRTGDNVVQSLVYDQYLPSDGAVHLLVNGTSRACIDTLFGQSLRASSQQLGLGTAIACLQTSAKNPGTVEVSYPGPDFGAGAVGATSYETASTGADGGKCSMTTSTVCSDDTDCPMGEKCKSVGTAFSLRYKIEKLPK